MATMSVIESTKTFAPAGTWAADPVHSNVSFEVAYAGVNNFRGSFTDFTASLVGDSLEGTAKVASVDVRDEQLNGHLQSPDFFDAERYPELRFVAEDVDLGSETVGAAGEITIKGVTKPVEVTGTLSEPIEDAWGNERLGLQLTATVDRTEFGLNWNMPLPTGDEALSNTVTVLAELQLVKAA